MTSTLDTTAPAARVKPRAAAAYPDRTIGFVLLAVAVALAVLRPALPEWLVRVPDVLILPWAGWLQALFDFIREDLRLEVLTRLATSVLEVVLDATANILHGKNRWPYLGPLPWLVVAAVTSVLGYWLGGWRLALLAGATWLWTAAIGQWELAMQTMSVIVVAAPLAFIIGLVLGIFAWKFAVVESLLKPVLALFQTLPFFTYLLPAVIFFKVGPTAATVATVAFAIPPMVLMTTLGLKRVSPDLVESGHMSGATRWQMLRHVYLPAARTEILVGLNQVIMLSLAMVVLTAFIGMPGLGAKLLAMMGSFKLGRSFEIGVTIVLLAVMLDRLSKAAIVKQPYHFEKGTPWWERHKFLLTGMAAAMLAAAIASFVPYFHEVGRKQDLSMGREIDALIKYVLDIDWIQGTTGWIRWFLITKVLIPFRDAILFLPTPTIILAFASVGWLVGGWRSALLVGGFFTVIAFTGWWDRSMITVYAVISAVLLAALIGIPMGILASGSEDWSRRVLLACDTAQTFPSFVYLIPAIMLFGVNDVAVIFSILIFAMVPLIRYTIEGIRQVPPEVLEAADMSGATRRQKMWKAQLPLAFPTMVVGFNQAIMFAFFMVIIAAFIGTQDLGQELQKTLAGFELGKNFVLGINVALMALAFDHLIMRWSRNRQAALGLR